MALAGISLPHVSVGFNLKGRRNERKKRIYVFLLLLQFWVIIQRCSGGGDINRSPWLKNASIEKSERNKPREGKGGKNPGRSGFILFSSFLSFFSCWSMIKLLPLSRRTDLNLLLCNNHKDLIFLRVYKRWIAFRPNQCGFFGTFSAKDRICCSVFVARVLRKTRTQLVSNILHHNVFLCVTPSVAHRR